MKWRLLDSTKGAIRRLGRLHSREKALSKSDEPKKVPGPIDDLSEEQQRPKKSSGSSNEKKTATKAKKKLKKPHGQKKHQSHLNLLIQVRKKKGCSRMIKEKKYLLCWG